MLKKVKIGLRFGIVYGLLFLIFILVSLFVLNRMEFLSGITDKVYRHPFAVSNAVLRVDGNIIRMHRSMKDIALSKDVDKIDAFSLIVDGYEEDAHRDFKIIAERFLGEKEMYENALLAFTDWKPIRDEVIFLMRSGKRDEAVEITRGKGSRHVAKLEQAMMKLNKFAQNKAASFMADAQSTKRNTLNIIYLLIIILAILGVVIVYFLTRSIIHPIGKLIYATDEIRKGRLNTRVTIDSQDEIAQLAGSFMRMTDDLRKKTTENEKQNWFKSGVAGLGEKIRGEQSSRELAKSIINYLTPYLNARIGTVYLVDERGCLQLTGSYGFVRRKHLSKKYKFGEGLVGQAAIEKQSILITDIPADYIKITSGLGEALPNNILVTPFIYEGEVKGVMEFGAFDEFSDDQIDFLGLVAPSIAIAFNTTTGRVHTQELLIKTQTQAEELQTREEELTATNEELECQAKSLKKSESALQAQQEELKSINEELEERSRALEKQKKDIEKKNHELEYARKQVEVKAQDLEMAGKYKSEFLANMSHELRTPLNSMLILSNRLSQNKKGTLTEKEVEYASTVHSSGKDLLVLINDILDLSKVEAGKLDLHLDDTRLADICEEMKQGFLPLAREKGLSFKVEISKDTPDYISSDIKRVNQVVKNLVSNAIKFTHEGGVTVSIYRPDHDMLFSSACLGRDNVIAISVLDTGIGIPEDRKRSIFESFQQADGSVSRKYGGTGLGLSISRELAVLLNGEIQLQSEEGEGSVFTLFLPIKIDESNELKPAGRQVAAVKPEDEIKGPRQGDVGYGKVPAAEIITPYKANDQEDINFDADPGIDDRKDITPNDRSVLIIEDDPHFAKILYGIAKERDFKCLIAGNGETGLRLASHFKPKAIILDLILPGINGWIVMERLKDSLDMRNIPVHIISGTKKNINLMKMGAIGFLSKPVSMETLENAFANIEEAITKKIKKALIVDNDKEHVNKILGVIENCDITYTVTNSNEKAYKILKSEKFDCVIIGMSLNDKTGFDLLEKIKKTGKVQFPPIIYYTDKVDKISSNEKDMKLDKFSDDIVIKKTFSPATLLDEVTLFLHTVAKDLPEDKRDMLRMAHDQEVALRGKRVLIVDDDERNVFALSSVLEEYGMKILIGRTGKEGLERLKNNPNTNLVLMDIMLPEMDGYEAIREIRKMQIFKKIPIIALTAKAMKGDRNKCIEAGANDYIAKPVEIDKLLSLLKVWLYK